LIASPLLRTIPAALAQVEGNPDAELDKSS
jgi:hypothetical protein